MFHSVTTLAFNLALRSCWWKGKTWHYNPLWALVFMRRHSRSPRTHCTEGWSSWYVVLVVTAAATVVMLLNPWQEIISDRYSLLYSILP